MHFVAPWAVQCKDKKGYPVRREARASRRRIPHGRKLRVYHCPHCELFHLGNNLDPVDRLIRLALIEVRRCTR